MLRKWYERSKELWILRFIAITKCATDGATLKWRISVKVPVTQTLKFIFKPKPVSNLSI